MELVKFRIGNYKSIVDSGDCYFSEKLTILAGKNESGKTSLLEALEDFQYGKKIRLDAKPIDSEEIPEITVTFNLTKDELIELFPESSFKEGVEISLSKKYDCESYELDPDSSKSLNLIDQDDILTKLINESIQSISEIINVIPNKESLTLPNSNSLAELGNQLKALKQQTQALTDITDEEKARINNELEQIENSIVEYKKPENLVSDFVNKFVKTKLPNFILFSSFEHEFPKSIKLAALPTDDWAKDLEKVSTFSISKISSTIDQERRNHQSTVNTEFTEKFKKFWTQDDIKLEIEKEGPEIKFWIVENGKQYYPSQRSKGQQWYLSFYIKIVARLNDEKANVILIDEPGLYLHAKAQKDLLSVLLEHSTKYPVIFSTHSPYLITEDNLENVRLIEKDEETKDTKVLGKVHAHPKANKETLTPILTAIGLGINDSIVNIDQKDNIVVEGPEDVFYLQAFKELFAGTRLNFINGGGAGNMGFVGAILEGWGANVYYLYDNDQGKKDGSENLKHNWKVLPEMVKSVLTAENSTIADILSQEDFKKYVLEKPDSKYTSSNSAYIKSKKLDKVLLARKFLQRVRSKSIESSDVSDTTKQNVEKLVREIDFK